MIADSNRSGNGLQRFPVSHAGSRMYKFVIGAKDDELVNFSTRQHEMMMMIPAIPACHSHARPFGRAGLWNPALCDPAP